jgi:Prokaryotic N-terminal methylation motif
MALIPIGARARDERGFSLVELMIVGLISTMVIGSAVMLSSQVNKTYSHQLNDAAVQQEARFAMEWITRTIAAAGSNPYNAGPSICPVPGTPFAPIWLDPDGDGANDDIRIHADVNPPNGLLIGGPLNGCVESGEDVTIAISNANAAPAPNALTRLDRGLEAVAVPVTDAVFTRLRFTYFNAAGAVTADPLLIARVQVDLTGQSRTRDPNTQRFTTYAYQSQVRVRSRQ